MDLQDTKGIIFDIQRFSIHDGPGIRTSVFFKGCPLDCVWCHNPESIESKREIAFYSGKCRFCGACVTVCKQKNHTLNRQNSYQHPRPEGTGYVVSNMVLDSGFNTQDNRPGGRGIKPFATNKNTPVHCFGLSLFCDSFLEHLVKVLGVLLMPHIH